MALPFAPPILGKEPFLKPSGDPLARLAVAFGLISRPETSQLYAAADQNISAGQPSGLTKDVIGNQIFWLGVCRLGVVDSSRLGIPSIVEVASADSGQ